MSIKAVLVGARGYVGNEIISILSRHPSIDLLAASSRELAGKDIAGYSKATLVYEELSPQDLVKLKPELVILALPNGLASRFVEVIEREIAETVVIDLSADFRFDDQWHYGLPEVYPTETSKRISNPGCYATAMQLSVAPVKKLVGGHVSCFGVSGYSGAGTTPSDKNNPDLLRDNIMPYKLAEHIHEQEVSRHLGFSLKFSPHVANFFRGISLTSHITLQESLKLSDVESLYQQFYSEAPLVSLQKSPPQVAQATYRHGAIVGGWELSQDGKHLAVNCALDNLLKGAATQAIQNINLAFQLPQLAGIVLE
ncbi:N-acetyl-gamma-glutamyl-phosphate reductase [Kangiella sediminilitoris]|uniref:N-acetyl-gamma-glutamyl-phosphate reductase n=1 Tax=Kangiella sediminilitoris TaxID=1144748 RepID=A0A1B3BCQ4_9GAMM|nr:N-acetyl-gamma-glutamyl-phosphate reductase [Kangiella sediminilitoris]AOE50606.1 N-acetyl-gamma-glutamyl-phosphate reductase [Kangiella sediminilitoris]